MYVISQREQDSFFRLFWKEMLLNQLLQCFEINKEQKLFPLDIKLHSIESMQEYKRWWEIAEKIQKTEPKSVPVI